MSGGELTFATEESFRRGLEGQAPVARRELLLVRVADELYGLEVPLVREIIKPRRLTEVPRMPGYLLGLLSVRGVVVPVLDLRLRLGLAAAAQDRATRIVVVAHDGERIGLLVDEVQTVLRLEERAIGPAPTLGSRQGGGQFVSAVGRFSEQGTGRSRVVVLLDLGAVIALDKAAR